MPLTPPRFCTLPVPWSFKEGDHPGQTGDPLWQKCEENISAHSGGHSFQPEVTQSVVVRGWASAAILPTPGQWGAGQAG